MHGPALSSWLLMVLCAATGAYCLLRAHGASGEERRTALSEALMGLGMAVMAVPASVLATPVWAWAVYAVLFGCAALRALRPAARGGHHAHHLVGSLAMVYMAVAMTPAGGSSTGHAGHGAGAMGGGLPVLTGLLLLYYALYVLRAAGRLIPVASTAAGGPASGVAPPAVGGGLPELALACRLTMAMAMFAMLLTV
ncbi:DUF5134 domain-containing protein [uncultured Streptomyces sp.]|uniref:DUF5134 domain-containing protein n=1 Tax=uncultured Streptomyces sp. TaxID=174707 RepID=UPI002630666E|nr:DUF5134 domain-containing protein [uncultured Streptomyces sp.]